MLGYLGRYTHRVAIANSRLVGFDNGQVSFTWKDYRQDGKTKVMTLSADEFIRRFLQHTVPSGFHRIRHIGFLANCHRAAKLALCRDLLAAAPPPDLPPPRRWQDRLRDLTGVEIEVCPCCGGQMLTCGIDAANSAGAPADVVRQFMMLSQLLPLRSATSGNADHGGARSVSRTAISLTHSPIVLAEVVACFVNRLLADPRHRIAPLVAAALDRRTDNKHA